VAVAGTAQYQQDGADLPAAEREESDGLHGEREAQNVVQDPVFSHHIAADVTSACICPYRHRYL
jgi:hypothetical protein